MSVEVMDWALEARVSGHAKLVLVGLAHQCHTGTVVQEPDHEALARVASADVEQVKTTLRALSAMGFVRLHEDSDRVDLRCLKGQRA